ncbi:HAD hydrolase-like protein [Streptococcus parauberis]|uniref:5'-nucleotidase n=3 Tax=Streptococcus parauberis TaxID=1348 RepID=A0A0E2UDR4_9STRE|nr:HAD hydrolase-like protein [Streptococcus parauberis]AEF26297.1 5'-nucleotidase [Streptococcus parauberis KCTC 11537]AUT04765.1 Phosphoglycolate phosphatase [Streptococcus parauberis]EGE54193.1 HAD hydrolase, family IA, variant 1 [Streptococcus parauberis NCFD 2020]EMF48806.1 Phosphoglycolate phosphatase [Streptococcus parauberis KRS-02109]EMG24512.1 Phosphoglycolate phosphatase [Streptococcus parauberis KRS-02083]
MTAILFDLDGTLVDSSQGIVNAFTHTFTTLNITPPDITTLSTYIGPPLETTFLDYFQEASEVEEAINHFRAYYKTNGVYQVHLYKGIKDLLNELINLNYDLYVTTSKHQPMAEVMLKELDIYSSFKVVYGSEKNRFLKVDVIKACLKENNISLDQAIIIGDTKFDMIGGKGAGIDTLGVTWGFGSKEDLLLNGANLIADTPKEIIKLLSK